MGRHSGLWLAVMGCQSVWLFQREKHGRRDAGGGTSYSALNQQTTSMGVLGVDSV
jgi:hypothetical protein